MTRLQVGQTENPAEQKFVWMGFGGESIRDPTRLEYKRNQRCLVRGVLREKGGITYTGGGQALRPGTRTLRQAGKAGLNGRTLSASSDFQKGRRWS